MADKVTVTVFKEIICSQCQEHYDVRLEPVYDDQGFLRYVRDDHAVNICPSCGNADRKEKVTKDGKVNIKTKGNLSSLVGLILGKERG